MYGKGWSSKVFLQDHTNESYRENIEFFAVKVSDEPNFYISDDLDYSGSLFSDSDGFTEVIDPACIGVQEDTYSVEVDGIETYSYHSQHIQQHGNYSLSFETYDGSATNASYDQVIGLRRHDSYTSIDHHCLESESECLAVLSLQTSIEQNNSSGISFTAKLTGNENLNNEVYIDTNVSVIIHPFEPTRTNSE